MVPLFSLSLSLSHHGNDNVTVMFIHCDHEPSPDEGHDEPLTKG